MVFILPVHITELELSGSEGRPAGAWFFQSLASRNALLKGYWLKGIRWEKLKGITIHNLLSVGSGSFAAS
jgi:hypothetical protein